MVSLCAQSIFFLSQDIVSTSFTFLSLNVHQNSKNNYHYDVIENYLPETKLYMMICYEPVQCCLIGYLLWIENIFHHLLHLAIQRNLLYYKLHCLFIE